MLLRGCGVQYRLDEKSTRKKKKREESESEMEMRMEMEMEMGGRGGLTGRGVQRECVDDVRLDGLEVEDHARTEEGCSLYNVVQLRSYAGWVNDKEKRREEQKGVYVYGGGMWGMGERTYDVGHEPKDAVLRRPAVQE